MVWNKIVLSSMVVMLVMSGFGYAQDTKGKETATPVTVKDHYNDIYNNSESYNEYKVVKATRLKSFWKVVEDSLNLYRSNIDKEAAMVLNKIETNKALQARIKELEGSLESSKYNTDRISIFGVSLKKNVYNWIVWLIITGLTFATFYSLSGIILIKRTSHKLKKEFNDLMEEFEVYKKKSYDNKIKMGRELQNERNMVEEMKAKLSTNTTRRPAKSRT